MGNVSSQMLGHVPAQMRTNEEPQPPQPTVLQHTARVALATAVPLLSRPNFEALTSSVRHHVLARNTMPLVIGHVLTRPLSSGAVAWRSHNSMETNIARNEDIQ